MSKPLNQIQHVGLTEANIAIPLINPESARIFREATGPIEVCYLALGTSLAGIEMHIARQRRSAPWQRQCICDPNKPDSVKIIVFQYRASLDHAISAFSKLGVPATEVREDDVPVLVRDVTEIIVGHEDTALLFPLGREVSRLVTSMRQAQLDEAMLLLKDPPSAETACWLLNFRDKLYGRRVSIKIEDLPWSIRLTDWDVLPFKAIHRDGRVIVFDGQWTSLPLEQFWLRYCKTLPFFDASVVGMWRVQLRAANQVKPREISDFEFDTDDFDNDVTDIIGND